MEIGPDAHGRVRVFRGVFETGGYGFFLESAGCDVRRLQRVAKWGERAPGGELASERCQWVASDCAVCVGGGQVDRSFRYNT